MPPLKSLWEYEFVCDDYRVWNGQWLNDSVDEAVSHMYGQRFKERAFGFGPLPSTMIRRDLPHGMEKCRDRAIDGEWNCGLPEKYGVDSIKITYGYLVDIVFQWNLCSFAISMRYLQHSTISSKLQWTHKASV